MRSSTSTLAIESDLAVSTPLVVHSESEAETAVVARALATVLEPGDVVALQGPLGAGKTGFSRGICDALDVPAEAGFASPSYALVHLYEGGVHPVAHLDLYRLSDEDELEGLGFRDLCDGRWVLLIEWPERVDEVLSLATCHVVLIDHGPTSREIRVSLHSSRAQERLAQTLGSRPDR